MTSTQQAAAVPPSSDSPKRRRGRPPKNKDGKKPSPKKRQSSPRKRKAAGKQTKPTSPAESGSGMDGQPEPGSSIDRDTAWPPLVFAPGELHADWDPNDTMRDTYGECTYVDFTRHEEYTAESLWEKEVKQASGAECVVESCECKSYGHLYGQ